VIVRWEMRARRHVQQKSRVSEDWPQFPNVRI
jgi:hypothetical protein